MDRASLAHLRRQPGYPAFLGAATLARVADEMFSVGVVLFVLERTNSPALAGATVAAVTLPSLVTGPLLGAWLDLTGKRRSLMIYDQLAISASLALILVLAGEAPDLLLPVSAMLLAGLTYPLSFGGMTSFIAVLVPDRLLDPANAIEASSFNVALIVGPALAGTLSAAFGVAAPLIVEIVLSLAALVLILVVPGLDREPDTAGEGRSLLGVARAGIAKIVEVPALRGVTVTGVLGLGGLGLLTVAFPFFCVEHLGVQRGAAGYLWAAFAFGSMVGALALVRLQRRFAPERIVIVGIALFGALMLLWPVQSSLGLMLVVVALAGLADGPALAATFAARQQHVPAELHGQVFTTAAGLKVGAFALGAALAGPVVLSAGSDGALLIAALVQFVAAGAGVTLMRVRRRPAPALG